MGQKYCVANTPNYWMCFKQNYIELYSDLIIIPHKHIIVFNLAYSDKAKLGKVHFRNCAEDYTQPQVAP